MVKQANVLTKEQLLLLWSELEKPYNEISKIAYLTGSRTVEVLRIQAKDISHGFLTFPRENTKTDDHRALQITSQLQSVFDGLPLPKSGLLFPSPVNPGKHITPRAVDKKLRAASALLGIPTATLHSFRRSLATHMHAEGVPDKVIMRLTGHKSLGQFQKYLDATAQDAYEAQVEFFDKWIR